MLAMEVGNMTMAKRVILTAVLLAAGVPGSSADTIAPTPAPPPDASFAGIEYVGGHPGFPKKIKGTLVLQPDELQFLDQKKRPVFTLAVGAGTLVTPSERREKTLGRVVLVVATFPFWAVTLVTGMAEPPSVSEAVHFVGVHAQTSSGAAVVTFRCPRKRCDAIASRINSGAAAAATPQ